MDDLKSKLLLHNIIHYDDLSLQELGDIVYNVVGFILAGTGMNLLILRLLLQSISIPNTSIT